MSKKSAENTMVAGGAEMSQPVLTEIVATGPAPQPVEAPKPLGHGLFPVRILKGYRPVGRFVMRPRENPEDEQSPRTAREPNGDEKLKVVAGRYIALELDEAKKIIKLGIAERDDEMRVD